MVDEQIADTAVESAKCANAARIPLCLLVKPSNSAQLKWSDHAQTSVAFTEKGVHAALALAYLRPGEVDAVVEHQLNAAAMLSE